MKSWLLEAMDHQKCMSRIAVLIDNIIKKQISFLVLFPCLKGKKKQPTNCSWQNKQLPKRYKTCSRILEHFTGYSNLEVHRAGKGSNNISRQMQL